MPLGWRNPCGLLLASLVLSTAACSGSDTSRVALIGATVISGSGSPPIPNAVVLINGTTIEVVGPRDSVSIPRGAEEIDLTGRWIIPGLIDADARAEPWALSRYLGYGVTAIRDVHSDTKTVAAMADETAMIVVLGPHIYFSGTPIGNPGANTTLSATEARRLVDDNALAGSDYIALGAEATIGQVRAVTDEASSFQLPVVASLGLTDAISATNAGIHSIVGLTGIPQAAAGSSAPFYAAYRQGFYQGWRETGRSWSRLRPATLDRIARQLVEGYVSLTPTLVKHEISANLDDLSAFPGPDPGAVPSAVLEQWDGPAIMRERGWSAVDLRTFRQGRAVQDRFVVEFKDLGGAVAAGSGAPGPFLLPGASLHAELHQLVMAGFSPMDALMAGTSTAAAVLGADSLGTIGPGNVADLLVLTANPLQDIRNTRSIETVVLRGNLMLVETIRAQWSEQ